MKGLTKNQYICLIALFILYLLYRCNRGTIDKIIINGGTIEGGTIEGGTIEGITNMNCCGGIKAGVHYLETDKKPPRFVKRCFQSNRGSDGSVEYEWDSYPCSQKGSSKCCGGKDGGECIPTKKGGYCKRSDGNDKVFNYKKGTSSDYIPTGEDTEIDINSVFEMEDFYENIGYSRKGLSRRQQEFEKNRRGKERSIEGRIIKRNIKRNLMLGEDRDKRIDELKQKQIASTITIVHVLFAIVFAYVIKSQIIQSIDEFFNLLSDKVSTFQGKNLVQPPENTTT